MGNPRRRGPRRGLRLRSRDAPDFSKAAIGPKAYARSLGQVMRVIRLERELSQDLVADAGGLSADTVRRCERGGGASMVTWAKLASGTGLRLSELVSRCEANVSGERGHDVQRLAAHASVNQLPDSRVRLAVLVLEAIRRA